jgi:hypothetical protein
MLKDFSSEWLFVLFFKFGYHAFHLYFLFESSADNLPAGNGTKVGAGRRKGLPLIGQRLLDRLQDRIFLYLLCCKGECGIFLSR